MKKLFSLGIFTLAGCSTGGSYYQTHYDNPDNFFCPDTHFAYCDGNSRTQMECQCIDRQYQRNIFKSLQGVL
jgi:hypothetical protein